MSSTIITKQHAFVKSHFHLTRQHDAKDQAEAAPKSVKTRRSLLESAVSYQSRHR